MKGLIFTLSLITSVSPLFANPSSVMQLAQNDILTVPIIVAPDEKAKLASPLTGFIEKIHFKVGQPFEKGDVLINFDCTVLRSEKEKVEASIVHLKAKAEGLERLYKLDGASKVELAETQSKLREAEEEHEIKSYLVSQCELKAPFKGQVTELYASTHEYIEQGKPLMDIVNLGDIELKLILPSEWLSWLKIGKEFNVKIFETNQTYPATITRLTYAVDPVSNTFTAYAAFVNKNADITPGMSGQAEFKR